MSAPTFDSENHWRAVAKRWERLYREAVGIPAPEHSRRRLETMAQHAESASEAAYQRGRAEVIAAVDAVLAERAYAYRDAPRSLPVVESVSREIRAALGGAA